MQLFQQWLQVAAATLHLELEEQRRRGQEERRRREARRRTRTIFNDMELKDYLETNQVGLPPHESLSGDGKPVPYFWLVLMQLN